MSLLSFNANSHPTYPIVDTGVEEFANNNALITAPSEGEAFYGQDASYIPIKRRLTKARQKTLLSLATFFTSGPPE